MQILGSFILPTLLLGAVMFVLGFAAGHTRAERRNRFYRRIWGM